MKKILFLLITLTPLLLNAQITITSSHLPFAGQTYVNANDDTYSATIPPGGANQTWNYTGLLNTELDTTAFLSAAATPYASSFPGSNLAIYTMSDSLYLYLTTNTNGLYIDGYYFNNANPPFGQNAIPFNPSNLFVPTPFTYQDTRTNTYKYVIDIDSVLPHLRFVHHVEQSFLGDGYGTLQLPSATYNNTLRIKSTELQMDSLLFDTIGNGSYFLIDPPVVSQHSSFLWFRASQPSLLLNLASDSLGIIGENSSYLYASATSVQETPAQKATNVRVYPNPARDFVQVSLLKEGDRNTLFRLSDIQGRVIRETSLEGMSQYAFYVNHLSAGVYIWSVPALNAQGRLIVE